MSNKSQIQTPPPQPPAPAKSGLVKFQEDIEKIRLQQQLQREQQDNQLKRQAQLLELQEKQKEQQREILLKLQEQQNVQEQLQKEIETLSRLHNKQIKELQDQHNFFTDAVNKIKYHKYKQKYHELKKNTNM